MSSPDTDPFAFSSSAAFKSLQPPAIITPGLPSPPLSAGEFELDINAPELTDLATPTSSTALISPKPSPNSTTSLFALDTSAAVTGQSLNTNSTSPSSTVEALSAHHLERYFHYKALATQAQAELSFSLFMGEDNDPFKDRTATAPSAAMLALAQPNASFFNTQPSNQQGLWNVSFQQQQQTAMQAHAAQAQAQAHLQAHEAAQQAVAAQRLSMTNYYMPPAVPRTALDGVTAPQPPPIWSRPSGPSSVSATSPPFPATPAYTHTAGAASIDSTSSRFSLAPTKSDKDEEDELDTTEQPAPPVNVNVTGGGRGYVPGKTPDDPKKRHKCQVCGRGFARAFNLKSHIATHDPLRPKPHQCPHPLCKRSFSRLHDLERHRQGIHSDGPLVDAKRQGVSPSVVRAQSRLQRRAESGGLI